MNFFPGIIITTELWNIGFLRYPKHSDRIWSFVSHQLRHTFGVKTRATLSSNQKKPKPIVTRAHTARLPALFVAYM